MSASVSLTAGTAPSPSPSPTVKDGPGCLALRLARTRAEFFDTYLDLLSLLASKTLKPSSCAFSYLYSALSKEDDMLSKLQARPEKFATLFKELDQARTQARDALAREASRQAASYMPSSLREATSLLKQTRAHLKQLQICEKNNAPCPPPLQPQPLAPTTSASTSTDDALAEIVRLRATAKTQKVKAVLDDAQADILQSLRESHGDDEARRAERRAHQATVEAEEDQDELEALLEALQSTRDDIRRTRARIDAAPVSAPAPAPAPVPSPSLAPAPAAVSSAPEPELFDPIENFSYCDKVDTCAFIVPMKGAHLARDENRLEVRLETRCIGLIQRGACAGDTARKFYLPLKSEILPAKSHVAVRANSVVFTCAKETLMLWNDAEVRQPFKTPRPANLEIINLTGKPHNLWTDEEEDEEELKRVYDEITKPDGGDQKLMLPTEMPAEVPAEAPSFPRHARAPPPPPSGGVDWQAMHANMQRLSSASDAAELNTHDPSSWFFNEGVDASFSDDSNWSLMESDARWLAAEASLMEAVKAMQLQP